MQKARRLKDENSVSFQMFLILLSSITLGSESQIRVFKEQYLEACFALFLCTGGACAGMHFARFNFSRLSLAFILKYYPILHALKR